MAEQGKLITYVISEYDVKHKYEGKIKLVEEKLAKRGFNLMMGITCERKRDQYIFRQYVPCAGIKNLE